MTLRHVEKESQEVVSFVDESLGFHLTLRFEVQISISIVPSPSVQQYHCEDNPLTDPFDTFYKTDLFDVDSTSTGLQGQELSSYNIENASQQI